MARKRKVVWTRAEQGVIVARAAEIALERPGVGGLELLRLAQKALPPERRRDVRALTLVPWFEDGVTTEVRRMAPQGDPLTPILEAILEAVREQNQLLARLVSRLEQEPTGARQPRFRPDPVHADSPPLPR